MTDFSTLLQHGNAWLFIPSAILLGALHGLEPGHSKTMMAAFIVAIRGTVGQAVLLGLSATLSHTAVVWAVALTGLYFGRNWNVEASEPWFQLISALLIIAVAAWMLWRTWREQQAAQAHQIENARNAQSASDDIRQIDTGHGVIKLAIAPAANGAVFRLYQAGRMGHHWLSRDVQLQTTRADGSQHMFSFASRMGYLESTEHIALPHAFTARLSLGHAGHTHDYDLAFGEAGSSDHEAAQAASGEYQDAHERAHANDIRRRFAGGQASTGQIVMFGLTGGLVPCPASITVLLLCLQLKKFSLGAALVLCFSIGLALTMVLSGTLAALSVHHVAKRWHGFGDLARKAPLLSGVLILLVGVYLAYHALAALL
ncbi:nickel/cobalt efflux transporter [Amantichitinum ursilacus]|uniref:Nickel/cobalt efflux system n=1 Tax=Amantichitinum ursilacus TaxID=857265 RepID=A0A0N0GL26_9NEIS|nr:nickel/cobalt efflux transporter [Amantichitinum ursilacus]KPC49654.1 Nickel/cobalt efflux system RcnA [Amantichitinum ursilacus]